MPTADDNLCASLASEVVAAVPRALGGVEDFPAWRGGYLDSLALCVIDSVQSMGLRYSTVELVVERYTERYPDAHTHGAAELLASFDDLGGPRAWASSRTPGTGIGTLNLTSTRNGVLKAVVVQEAAHLLVEEQVPDTATLRSLVAADEDGPLKKKWRQLHGQGTGISWRYLVMLAGAPGVKPDRMIHRFLVQHTSAEEGVLTNDQAAAVVAAAAEELGISATHLDHVMWAKMSEQAKQRRRRT